MTAPTDAPHTTVLTVRARALLDSGADCLGDCCVDLTPELRCEAERLALADAVALLDSHGPAGWRARVDPDRLDMNDPQRCVLGQLYESYADGLRTLYGEYLVGPGRTAFGGTFVTTGWLAELRRRP
jgi:hypothetical protein